MLCWAEGGSPQGQSNHIIQIGLVEVATETLAVTRSKSYYIRPQNREFEVSDYCTDLTGITRSTIIDFGRYFPEVMKTIQKEFAPQNKITYAWGSDFEPIAKHCDLYSSSNPWITTGILDFGVFFRSAYNIKNKLPLIDALAHVGLPFEGRQHNAEFDALALAHLHNETIRRIRQERG